MADTLERSRDHLADRASARGEGSRTERLRAMRLWPISWRAVGIWLGAYVALTTVWTLAGLVVTTQLEGTELHRRETGVVRWFADARSDTLTEVSHWISFSGDAVPKTIFIAVLAVAFIVWFKRAHEALFLVAVMGLEVAVFGTASTLVGRDRPPVEQLDGSLPTASFPSGHVAASFALYGALAVIVWLRTSNRTARIAALAFALVWPVGMIFIRLYRGMHYLSDTIAGALLGVVSIAAGYAVVQAGNRALARRRDDVDPAHLRLDQSDTEPVR